MINLVQKSSMDRANKSIMMEIKLTLTQYATHSFMFEQFSGIQLFIYVKSVAIY